MVSVIHLSEEDTVASDLPERSGQGACCTLGLPTAPPGPSPSEVSLRPGDPLLFCSRPQTEHWPPMCPQTSTTEPSEWPWPSELPAPGPVLWACQIPMDTYRPEETQIPRSGAEVGTPEPSNIYVHRTLESSASLSLLPVHSRKAAESGPPLQCSTALSADTSARTRAAGRSRAEHPGPQSSASGTSGISIRDLRDQHPGLQSSASGNPEPRARGLPFVDHLIPLSWRPSPTHHRALPSSWPVPMHPAASSKVCSWPGTGVSDSDGYVPTYVLICHLARQRWFLLHPYTPTAE